MVFAPKEVTTAKPHKCWGCAKEYPSKTRMEHVTTVDGGVFLKGYWCNTCQDFMKGLDAWDLEDGFPFGGLLEYEDYPKETMTPPSKQCGEEGE